MNIVNKYQADTIQQDSMLSVERITEHAENFQEEYNLRTTTDTVQKDTVYGFENHQLIPTRNVETQDKTVEQAEYRFRPEKREIEVAPWQTLLLVFCFFMLAFTRAFNSTRFKESYKALFNYSVAQEIIREEKVFFHRVNLVITLIYIITMGLIILLVRDMLVLPNYNKLLLYLSVLGALILTYLVKYLVSRILFFIYDSYALADEYIFNVSLYNGLLGVLFIPVLSIAFFTSINTTNLLHYIILPLLLIILIARVLRLTLIGSSNGILYLYIFLYICTLEILPLVVLYGIFIHN